MSSDLPPIVLSLKPVYGEPILDGAKRVELRRRFPASLALPRRGLIYLTAPGGCLAGEVRITSLEILGLEEAWERYGAVAGIDRPGYDAYLAGLSQVRVLRLEEPRRYLRPIPLEEMMRLHGLRAPQLFAYAPESLVDALQEQRPAG
ncbi:hypothetical protein LAZ40_11800 [Cereibacter sphaeroides]|uniref:hypothetical protein n=1 Tax=Cereibacter sphaeroides TaxID=1063 RepID=UPI001F443F20|nr:hypothetical protein [Cereibacter sphaeroides]MCE6959703.1 hypothetical protein [Cereibacter sphaeroides]MCE6974436.1 hypothetical protein [Cereibacter sphaeroides]